MGAFKLQPILKHIVVLKKWGTYSAKKRLEDMMEVIDHFSDGLLYSKCEEARGNATSINVILWYQIF